MMPIAASDELAGLLASFALRFLILDEHGRVRRCSSGMHALLGHPSDLTGRAARALDDLETPGDARTGRLFAGLGEAFDQLLAGDPPRAVMVTSAEQRDYLRTIEALLDPQGRRVGAIVLFQDPSREPRPDLGHGPDAIARVQAGMPPSLPAPRQETDTVTGLPFWSQCRAELDDAIASARHAGGTLSVFFLDIDDFRRVNTALGRDAGDAMLGDIATRLRRTLGDGVPVCRPSGDDFVFFVGGLTRDAAAALAQCVLSQLGQAVAVDDYLIHLSGSIGIAVFPQDGETLPDLLARAEAACHRSAAEARDEFRFYEAGAVDLVRERMRIEAGLYRALRTGELSLHFQPMLGLRDALPVAAEALLRWRLPDGRRVPTRLLIDVAEETQLIRDIGGWVLTEAAAHAQAWAQAGHPLPVAVNVSPLQFRRQRILDQVDAALANTGLPPQLLEIEITESLLLDNSPAIREALVALRAKGLRLAIDDFGTGFSNLAHLRQCQAHKLKIDQSFIQHLGDDEASRRIVATVLALARSLGLRSVAEGVETVEQLDLLREMGCDAVQGYLYSHPLAPDAFTAFLHQASRGREPTP